MQQPTTPMFSIGIALMLLAAAAGFFIAQMDTTVSSTRFSLDRVHNTGLLHQQLMMVLAACTAFIAGTILAAGGAIVNKQIELSNAKQHAVPIENGK